MTGSWKWTLVFVFYYGAGFNQFKFTFAKSCGESPQHNKPINCRIRALFGEVVKSQILGRELFLRASFQLGFSPRQFGKQLRTSVAIRLYINSQGLSAHTASFL